MKINNSTGFKIKTILDAFPSELLKDAQCNFGKNKQANLIYIILVYQVIETNQYIISFYIFKKCKKFGNAYMKNIKTETHTFKSKLEVSVFLYNFLEKFPKHESIVNTFNQKEAKIMDVSLFVDETTEWVKSIILAFNEVIQTSKL